MKVVSVMFLILALQGCKQETQESAAKETKPVPSTSTQLRPYIVTQFETVAKVPTMAGATSLKSAPQDSPPGNALNSISDVVYLDGDKDSGDKIDLIGVRQNSPIDSTNSDLWLVFTGIIKGQSVVTKFQLPAYRKLISASRTSSVSYEIAFEDINGTPKSLVLFTESLNNQFKVMRSQFQRADDRPESYFSSSIMTRVETPSL